MASWGIVDADADADGDGDLYDEFRKRVGEDQTIHAELRRPHLASKEVRKRLFVHCSEFHIIK